MAIFVEGREHEVEEDGNLLQAILDLGYDLPYFCWHPALGSMGACRQCAVKQFRDADDRDGMIIMACMTPVSEGLRISVTDPEATRFRASVIEWLMTNHPHDCPVCDEGGECHLQDMTVMAGHDRRTHRFNKRTFTNQDLGPFINHEMNRCIQCYRCVRFYRDYAGGTDFNVFGSRNRIYFGRVEDGTLESPFSGNLAEICPTGVFTDKTAKARTVRSWDLQTAPSVCMLCGLGCNILPGERHGLLRRIRNRYHGEINRYFLCDRGRFGYEFVNSPRRVRQPVIRSTGESIPKVVPAEQAIDHVAGLLGSGSAIGIGSPTASLEANFALRTLVGPDNFFVGFDRGEAVRLQTVIEILREGPARTPSLREVELADAVLILGEDPTNTAPLLDLAVRQAVLNVPLDRARALGIPDWNDAVNRLVINREWGPLFIATSARTALDDLATAFGRTAPQDIARAGFAIASAIDPGAPAAGDLPEDLVNLVAGAAAALKTAKRPLVVSGTGSANHAVLQAASNIARALCRTNPETGLCLVVPHCNSLGLGLLGAPDLDHAATTAEGTGVTTAIVLEPEAQGIEERNRFATIADAVDHVVILDHLESSSTERAEIVLPAATFAESGGTVVNNEGRAQRFFQVFVPAGEVRPSWRWLQQITERVRGADAAAWDGPDQVGEALAEEIPVFGPITELVPEVGGARRGIPRQSHRVSGRTGANAHLQIREAQPPHDHESPLVFTMEGSLRRPPAGLITRYWSPGWNSVQALTRFQEEIGGPLRGGDPGLRLLDGSQGGGLPYFDAAPDAFTPRADEWLLVPLHHLFGSEKLSLETPGAAEQAPQPYIALDPEDGRRLGVEDGDMLGLEIDGKTLELGFKPGVGIPHGCAGVPVGLPGLPSFPDECWLKLRRLP